MKEPEFRYLDGQTVPLSTLSPDLLAKVIAGVCKFWPEEDPIFIKAYAAILLKERGL